jgi:subtilisin family serine protease
MLVEAMVSLSEPASTELGAWRRDIAAVQASALACGSGVTALRVYRNLPLLHVRAEASALARLERCPGVEAVAPVMHWHPTLAESIPLIGADTVHSSPGWTGLGTTVAVVDTGADDTQAELAGKIVYAYDHADGDEDASDCHGHGTNVAAIAAGTSGVAPGAGLAIFKVFGGGSCDDASDDVIAAGLDDVIERKDAYGIVAVNLSLGTEGFTTSLTCIATGLAMETAIKSVHKQDIAVIVAAGNDGDPDGVSFPACMSSAVAVANSYDADVGGLSWCTDSACSGYCTDGSTAADQINCSSDGGKLIALAAPGSMITAGGQTMGGTSQAAPHVAGAVALLAEAVPDATREERESWVTRSAHTVHDARGATPYDYPRLDLPTIFSVGQAEDVIVTAWGVAGGDGDEDAEAGEDLALSLDLTVDGPAPVDGLTLALASGDPTVAVSDGAGSLSHLDVGGTAPNDDGFGVSVSPDCRADVAVEMTLTVTDAAGNVATDTFELDVVCTMDDDGDGVVWFDDCDDTDPTAFPGGTEVCGGGDEDCDGTVDEDEAADALPWYADADLDGAGDPAVSTYACTQPAGYAATPDDCADDDASRAPGVAEVCDGVDQDCDGISDQGGACGDDVGVTFEFARPPRDEGLCGTNLVGFAAVFPLLGLRRRRP